MSILIAVLCIATAWFFRTLYLADIRIYSSILEARRRVSENYRSNLVLPMSPDYSKAIEEIREDLTKLIEEIEKNEKYDYVKNRTIPTIQYIRDDAIHSLEHKNKRTISARV